MDDKKKSTHQQGRKPHEPLDVLPDLVKTVVHETSDFLGRMVNLFLAGPAEPPASAASRPSEQQPESEPEQAEEVRSASEMNAREMIESLPRRFLAEKAGELSLVVHFDLSGPEGGRFSVWVEKGTCRVEPELQGTPDCLVQARAEVYRDIELGRMNPKTAYLFGKVKISDVVVLTRFAELFQPVSELKSR